MSVLLDVFLVICFLLTMAAGIRNGFFRELFAVLGLAAGLFVGLRYTHWLLLHLPPWARHSTVVTGIGFTILFFVAYGILALIGKAFASTWEGKEPGGLSRLFGLVLGSARGLALVLVLAGVLALLARPGSPTLGRSRVLPYLTPGIVRGAELLPPDLEGRVVERWGMIPFSRHGSESPPQRSSRGRTVV